VIDGVNLPDQSEEDAEDRALILRAHCCVSLPKWPPATGR
jgi:hypothetical protein